MGKTRYITAAAAVLLVAMFVVMLVPVKQYHAKQQPISFGEYQRNHEDAVNPQHEVSLKPSQAVLSGDAKTASDQEVRDAVECKDGGLSWSVDIPESGFYNMELFYKALPGKGKAVELSLEIDGEIPFDGANSLRFSRLWQDVGSISEDSLGNQIRPKTQEIFQWQTQTLMTDIGVYYDRCAFYFSKGKHQLAIRSENEPFLLGGLTIKQSDSPLPYAEVSASYPPAEEAVETIKIQAESSYQKNDSILYPFADKGNAATEPSHPSLVRLNTIGDRNWKEVGKWISWKVTVPKTGLYQIALKAAQDYNRGMTVTRRLYIDGKTPFAEAETIEFPYNENWYAKVIGNENPYLFYLTEGEHEIKLEAVLGKVAPVLETVNDAVIQLNRLYRQIIQITGTTPDVYRNYNLEKQIPTLLPSFQNISAQLRTASDELFILTGTRGSEAASLDRMADQLDSFVSEPDSISKRLENYISNVSSLSLWVFQVKEQPLRLDYLTLLPPGAAPQSPKAGFFTDMKFSWDAFLSTFRAPASKSAEQKDLPSLKVWVSAASGVNIPARDMAQIIKSLADDKFTPNTGILVDINLVEGSLVQATLAGKGPDVALTNMRDQPVNLAMRGAVTDLSQFSDFKTVSERFYPSAFIPYTFNGGYYALPETQNFNMLFYRKDILEELGCTVPNTWEEFYQVLSVIQKNNLEVGVPYSQTAITQSMFETFLFQSSMSYYKDDLKMTAFDEPEALRCFKEWTGLYTRYGLPLTYDFYNRFRTGQMPLAIASYTQYNLLSMGAPELRNLWDFAPIPGVQMPNGEINRAEDALGTSCMILNNAKDKDGAWEFIKWWTSAEIQSQFGLEVEAFVGPAARYDTANIEAFDQLPWTKTQASALKEQWKYVYDVPEAPGGYYVNRNLLNAFRNVVYNYENPRETLDKYNTEMNKEIERKRKELGLQ